MPAEIGYSLRIGRGGSLDCVWGVQTHSEPPVFLVPFRKDLARMNESRINMLMLIMFHTIVAAMVDPGDYRWSRSLSSWFYIWVSHTACLPPEGC